MGTRGSILAMWQARWVSEHLRSVTPDCLVELVEIKTRGDEHQDLGSLPGMGHFTSELEAALGEGRIDVAVHSLKDLPVDETVGVTVAAIPLRHDSSDSLVSSSGASLMSLGRGSRIGTGSPRRAALLMSHRPDLDVVEIRGNVDTRIRKVDEGTYDAVVLATAGLLRLGLEDRISEKLDVQEFPPAPGQGALAVQMRDEDSELHRVVKSLDDPDARVTSGAERAFLRGLGGGCALPVGAHAWREYDQLRLLGFVGSNNGGPSLRAEVKGGDPEALGEKLAEYMLSAGARDLL
ncbi:MAG TPA: hydroxymethylbilane synthase [Gemmatimonadetes bacterium]|nr:hydroxymethylbilane synthase [Gemmatimonadota bacterium]